jgi:hypothetical protein
MRNPGFLSQYSALQGTVAEDVMARCEVVMQQSQ